MRLYLVRHGRPAIAARLCYGSSDIAVPGAEDERVAAALAPLLPAGTPVHASSLQRCVGLAGRLAEALGVEPAIPDPRLREMDFGAWEMQAWDAIPRAEVDAWAEDLLHYRPGGGECVLDVARRVAAFLADLQASGHARAIVVCHAGTIRLLTRLHLGGPVEACALQAAREPHRIAYGELVILG
ncbi:MAG TPA: histidine phosphatase family protein [Noviherbaspirillum sp.]|jgi:alpha-ribazole phosphatase|uniref:histidine phosphatase family protein n=1 Tax=Noviherbaspirillum sp. TaxID=1926288 RepID=UPI002F94400A